MHTAWQTFFVVLPCSVDVIISLIVPLANLGFARGDIHIMTDGIDNNSSPWDLPTKENIVSHPV